MTATQQMQHMATLSTVHDALNCLVREKLISDDERMRMVRKWMDDRPAFKFAVQEALTIESRR